MFDFGREYPAYEYGANNDSIRRIDQAELSKEAAQGMLLAGSAEYVGVIDFVRSEHRTIGFEMAPVETGVMRCTGTFIPRFATRVVLSH